MSREGRARRSGSGRPGRRPPSPRDNRPRARRPRQARPPPRPRASSRVAPPPRIRARVGPVRSAARAPSAMACSRLCGWRSATSTERPWLASSPASMRPIEPPPSTPTSVASDPRVIACRRRSQGLSHGGCLGCKPLGNRVQGGPRSGDPLGKAAEHPRRRAADLDRPHRGTARRRHRPRSPRPAPVRPVSSRLARGLVPEQTGIGCQRPMAVAPHLHVGTARGGGQNLDDHLAGGLGQHPRRAGPPGRGGRRLSSSRPGPVPARHHDGFQGLALPLERERAGGLLEGQAVRDQQARYRRCRRRSLPAPRACLSAPPSSSP